MISKLWTKLLILLGLKKKTVNETIFIKEAISMDTEPTEVSISVEPKTKKPRNSKATAATKAVTKKKRSTKK